MKYRLIILIMLTGKIMLAHQPDLSTVIISKTDSGQIILQITSSLTAFQNEVNYNNPKDSYKSPEEFRNLVIKHFYKSFSIVLNNKDTLKFLNPTVILGHETKIVTEALGMPKNINIISLNNQIFKDIHNNQSTVIFFLEGFPSNKNYVLNNDNKQQLNIELKNGDWVNFDTNNNSYLWLALSVFILLVIGFLFYLILKKKK